MKLKLALEGFSYGAMEGSEAVRNASVLYVTEYTVFFSLIIIKV